MNGDSVSVVVPTRNRKKLLVDSLRALQHQDVEQFEILVVDDCSSDGTAEFVTAVGDGRVRLVRNSRPLGVAAARNRGLDAARGKWVAFCDDDDLWSPRKTREQLSALASKPRAGWCSVGAVTVDDRFQLRKVQRPPRGEDLAARLLAGNIIPGGGSGVLARAEVVRAVGGFDERLSMFADWDLWIRLALKTTMARVDEPLVVTVRHDQNMSLDVSRSCDELQHIGQKYADERTSRGIEADSARMLLWIAKADARAGQRLRAVRLCVALARRQHSWKPVRRAVLAALGPRAVEMRDNYRSARLTEHERQDGADLLQEVNAMLESS